LDLCIRYFNTNVVFLIHYSVPSSFPSVARTRATWQGWGSDWNCDVGDAEEMGKVWK